MYSNHRRILNTQGARSEPHVLTPTSGAPNITTLMDRV